MNANELADELEKVIDVRHYASEVLRKEVITMLRQQQADLEHMWMANTVLEAEIEALKEQLETAQDEYCQLLNGEDY